MAEYNTKTWADGIGGSTPITAAELNRIEAGIIKGIGGTQVLPPASPTARDDEFDGTSTATWANTPTAPTSVSANGTVPNALLVKSSGIGGKHVGRIQATPTLPFTVTTRLLMSEGNATYQKCGLVLGQATPTGASSMVMWGPVQRDATATPYLTRWSGTYDGAFSSEGIKAWLSSRPPIWLRMVVNSATSVDLQWSAEGYHWITYVAAFNPGFTPGSIGLTVNDEGANSGMSAVFDFFRVT